MASRDEVRKKDSHGRRSGQYEYAVVGLPRVIVCRLLSGMGQSSATQATGIPRPQRALLHQVRASVRHTAFSDCRSTRAVTLGP
jgi:hypothetical protein